MVIANPKLSLPTDLPYKKRQRPFNPNTSLQQATIRYNEALRKQYNDVQFAKRFENGYISQNELISVNTIDLGRNVEPDLFSEMGSLNPLPIIRQRKSRKVFICSGSSNSGGEMQLTSSPFCNGTRYYPSEKITEALNPSSNNGNYDPTQASSQAPPQIDCNNTEMFPHLLSTVGPNHSAPIKVAAPPASSLEQVRQERNSGPSSGSNYPSTASSLEAQAITEYVPTLDSAHDMIFGNVMGIDYGNYVHGPLWPTPPPPQQSCSCSCSNELSFGLDTSCPQFTPSAAPPHPQSFCGPPPVSKSVGFNLPSYNGYQHQQHQPQCLNNHQPNPYFGHQVNYDTNNVITISPLTNIGGAQHIHHHHSVQYPSSGGHTRRSTSVPRPRTGTRKETLKQAAIRCGIIKGNQTVPVIPKRSQCLYPLQLAPVQSQSDSTFPVVEILHPRTLIPTCSSEALVDDISSSGHGSCLKKKGSTETTGGEDARIKISMDDNDNPETESREDMEGNAKEACRNTFNEDLVDDKPLIEIPSVVNISNRMDDVSATASSASL